MVRFLYLVEQSSDSVLFAQPTLDELELAQTAEGLVAGEGFGAAPLFKAPLYPVFLAACMRVAGDGWFWLARFLQHLGGAVLVGLAFDTARRLMPGDESRKRIAGAVAACFLTFYAPLIRLECRLVMDFVVTLLQSAMVWALVRESQEPRESFRLRWLLVAGGFAALSWLTRPTITPVLPLLAVLMAVIPPVEGAVNARARMVRLCAFLLLPCFAMGGVMMRNAVVGGDAMLLPWQGGYSLYHANRPGANGRYYVQDGFSSADSGNPTRDLMVMGYHQAVAAGEVAAPEKEQLAGAVNAYWMRKFRGVLLEDPMAWLGKMVQKGLYLTTTRELFNFEAFEIHWKESGLLRMFPFGFGWVWPLALTTLCLPMGQTADQKRGMGLLWAYLILIGGAIALAYTSGRLRMPLIFPVVVCAALAVTTVFPLHVRGLGKARIRSWGAGFLFLMGVAMSWGDWWGVRSETVAHFDLARMSDAAWKQGRFAEALAYAQEAEVLEPAYLPLPLLQAQALYRLGEVDAAEAAFLKAFEVLPDDPTPMFNLGFIAYYDRSDPEQAQMWFARALARKPEVEDHAVYVILSQLRLGNLIAARAGLESLQQRGGQPSLLSQIAWVALLNLEGKKEEAKQVGDRVFKPLPPELIRQVQEELRILLHP